MWELSPRSPSPSHPSLTCLGLPGRLKALTPHVLTSTITAPPPLVQHQGPQYCKRVLQAPLALPVPETRKHSLDTMAAAFGSCQLLQVALHLQILLSSASTYPAFPSLGYLKAVSGPALCHVNRKVVVATSSSPGMGSAPTSHSLWHHPYPCRPHSPLSPCFAHTNVPMLWSNCPAMNSDSGAASTPPWDRPRAFTWLFLCSPDTLGQHGYIPTRVPPQHCHQIQHTPCGMFCPGWDAQTASTNEVTFSH